MKPKKCWVLAVIVAIFLNAFGSVLLGEEKKTQTENSQALRAEIDSLKETIRTQREQITRTEKLLSDLKRQLDEQIEENKRLRLLCEKAEVHTTQKAAESVSPGSPIIYRGQERTKEWFERMYEMFSDKIALANDKFVDLRTFKPKELGGGFVEIGTIVKLPELNCFQEVISVTGDGEALIHCRPFESRQTGLIYTGPGFICHLCGYDRPLIDGASLGLHNLICVGTYEYTSVLGAKKTVQSFKTWEPKPLTREQFAEAVNSGFELVNYVKQRDKTVKKPIR